MEVNLFMDKSLLRDILFKKYFQVEEGILISDLVNSLSFIPEVWKKLHYLCVNNVKYFHPFSTLEMCKVIEHNKSKYFILKISCWRYIIIDTQKRVNITEEEFKKEFNEEFFVKNFNEPKLDDDTLYSSLYYVSKYNGNVDELLDFYIENEQVLGLTTDLRYKLEEGNAWTYLNIDFANSRIQMGFQTSDQFLYEQLFLKYDLTPSIMQDAQEKMGIEKMNEIFNRIRDIIIPIECIPNDLYQMLMQSNVNNKVYKKNNMSGDIYV